MEDDVLSVIGWAVVVGVALYVMTLGLRVWLFELRLKNARLDEHIFQLRVQQLGSGQASEGWHMAREFVADEPICDKSIERLTLEGAWLLEQDK